MPRIRVTAIFWQNSQIGARNSAPAQTLPAVLRDSRYEADREYPLGLLAATSAEQKSRFRTLALLSAYVASGAKGRRRELVNKEIQALRDLYEAVWGELDGAFGDGVVRAAKEAVGQQVSGVPVHGRLFLCFRKSMRVRR